MLQNEKIAKNCLDPKRIAPQRTIESSTLFLELETWVVRVHKITVEPHHIPIDNVIKHYVCMIKNLQHLNH
jgi:hypothetical protein